MTNPAWRGARHLRVTLVVEPDVLKVDGLQVVDGPAVQRPVLDGAHLALVSLAGAAALLVSFDDPLVVRGASRREQAGHRFDRTDQGRVVVDVPLPADGLPGDIAIRVVDLAKAPKHPTTPESLAKWLADAGDAMRTTGVVTMADLVRHPAWTTTGLPGTATPLPVGHYELYVDRAGQYRWRLRRPDGEIVADSGQGYRDRAACEADLRWIREHAGAVEVRALDLP